MTEARSLNLELLIKLLKMTTSAVDGEALSAMRKANEQLLKVGGDWETLLRGKVTLVADPFTGVEAPKRNMRQDHWGTPKAATAPPPTTPSKPVPSTPPRYRAPNPHYTPPPPPPPPPPAAPKATRRNNFSGHCFACGTFVDANKGWIFQRGASITRWEVLCDFHATSTSPLPSKRAKPQPATIQNVFNSL